MSLLQRLRDRRHAIARWLVAVMLMPLLVGMLPPLPLSADAALARDIAASLCATSAPDQPDRGGTPDDHHRHCIVSALGCGCAVAGTAGRDAAVALAAPDRQARALVATAVAGPRLWADLAVGHRPRGPPAT